jgi:hypothetical protein
LAAFLAVGAIFRFVRHFHCGQVPPGTVALVVMPHLGLGLGFRVRVRVWVRV